MDQLLDGGHATTTAAATTRVAHIMYLDDRTREWLRTDTISGVSGERMDYDVRAHLDEFANDGYALVENGFSAGQRFRLVPRGDQIFTVHLYSLYAAATPATVETTGNWLQRTWQRLALAVRHTA